jgi:hypothetical protein
MQSTTSFESTTDASTITPAQSAATLSANHQPTPTLASAKPTAIAASEPAATKPAARAAAGSAAQPAATKPAAVFAARRTAASVWSAAAWLPQRQLPLAKRRQHRHR